MKTRSSFSKTVLKSTLCTKEDMFCKNQALIRILIQSSLWKNIRKIQIYKTAAAVGHRQVTEN